jgi:hypothetical protein
MALGSMALGARGRGAERSFGCLRATLRLYALLIVAALVLAAVAALRGIVAHGEWAYSDGVLLYHILRVRDGFALYDDFRQPPFLMLPYWPLQVIVAGLLARLAQLDTAGTLYVARGLTFAGALLGAFAVMGITRHYGARRGSALVAGGLFLTSYTMHPWTYALRFDATALGLVLAGVWVIVCRRSRTSALLAGVLMALAFCTKQSFVVVPAAMTLALLWNRRWTWAASLVVGWLLVVGPMFAYLQWSSGGWFIQHTISGNVQPLRPASLLAFLPMFVVMGAPILSLASVALVRPAHDGSRPYLLCWYGLLALGYGTLTLMRAGSDYNHLIEATAVLAMLAGLGFDRALDLSQVRSGRAVSSWATTYVVVALLLALAPMPALMMRLSVYARLSPDSTELIDRIRSTPGPVLTEREAFAVVMAGKEPIGGEPFGIGLLSRAGQFDPSVFNAYIDDRTFDLIVLRGPVEDVAGYFGFDWWPPGTRELIADRYRFESMLDGFYLYVPTDPPRTSSASDDGGGNRER